MVFDNGWPLIRADAGSLFSSSVIVSAVRLALSEVASSNSFQGKPLLLHAYLELNLVEPIG